MFLLSRILALLITFAVLPAEAKEVKVTFLLASDVYKLEGAGPRGGFARLNGVVKAERGKGGHVVYAFAGDLISPSLLSGFDQGAHTIAMLNLAPPNVFVPGNHEFDFGPDVFRKRMGEAQFLKLAANLRDEKDSVLAEFSDAWTLITDDLRIAIVGVTTDESPTTSRPGKLQFTGTVDTAVAQAKALRQAGADFVAVVAHANRTQDRQMFDSGAFDLILSGHDHDLMMQFDGRTAMAEPKEEAEFVMAIDVAFDIVEKDGKRTLTWWPQFRVIDTADIAPDPASQEKTEAYLAELSKELDVTIGTTVGELDSRKATVRGGEAAIGNLIADAMREAVAAQVAITNGGGIRGNKQYAAGSAITRRDILNELPFGNKTVKLEVTGAMLLAALEHGVGQVENAAGRFPQVSGLTVVYDPSKPAGQRIISAEASGKPIDAAANYILASNDYMFAGGDGYDVLKDAKPLHGARDAKLIANDVMAYVAARKEVAAKIEGRIKAK